MPNGFGITQVTGYRPASNLNTQGFTMAGNMPNSLPTIAGHGARCERQAFTECHVGRLRVPV
jgi:hypothetical protein